MPFTFGTRMFRVLEAIHDEWNPAYQTWHRYTAHDDALRANLVFNFGFDVFVAVKAGNFVGNVI